MERFNFDREMVKVEARLAAAAKEAKGPAGVEGVSAKPSRCKTQDGYWGSITNKSQYT